MKKVVLVLAALLLVMCSFTGCMLMTSCNEVTDEELTDEAIAAFSELSGDHGIMLYLDPMQNSKLKVRMYAVLYGESGQKLTANHSGDNLYLKVSGDANEGFTVWRVIYSPMGVSRLEFRSGKDTLTMDGYEELTFTVEKDLEKAEEE